MTYLTESKKTHSEKITLVTCEATERVKLFSLVGSDYERTVENFVVGVKIQGTSLTESVLPLSLNEWNYNPKTKKLLINVSADPKTLDISLIYRFFFSNSPLIFPFDLSMGEKIEWNPIISSIGAVGQQLDSEAVGIILETNSSVDFINSGGFFDNKFSKLIFENQSTCFYSYINGSVLKIFEGVVESKSFSESKVSFKVKDFVYKLKNKVSTGLFSELDGIMLPSLMGTSKRRIYGKADNVECASVSATLNGYTILGNVSVVVDNVTMTGVGTYFLSDCSPSDELIFIINGAEEKIAIESIQSNTSLTLGKKPTFSISLYSVKLLPKNPSRSKNRLWMIAGHELRSPSATIITVEYSNQFIVNSVLDIFAGDEVIINGVASTVRRISDSRIITSTNIYPLPVSGDLINKNAVSAAYFKNKRLYYPRDYTVINTGQSFIELNSLAEFNITESVGMTNIFSFVNGSRDITTTEILDLRSILKPGDWIKSNSIYEPDWYEILQVLEQSVILRTSFLGATASKQLYYKNIEYIDENSLITVDAMGMEKSGKWIKTPSDAVRDMILSDAGFALVNESSFSKASADCDYILSMVIPDKLASQYPLIRDVITSINESCFGVLYGDSSQSISYSIFNAKKPEIMEEIKDDDILSFSVNCTQQIVNEVKVNYRPFVDKFTGEDAFKSYIYNSSFVDNLIGIKNTLEKTIYLYEDDKAQIIAQRLCFFRSLSNSTIILKTKMNLSSVVVSDKLLINLDRMFQGYGVANRSMIGVVTGIKKGEFGCEISISDLSNIYSRVMAIAPNTALPYNSSSEIDKIKWCYILDNDTETVDPLYELTLGTNLIG